MKNQKDIKDALKLIANNLDSYKTLIVFAETDKDPTPIIVNEGNATSVLSALATMLRAAGNVSGVSLEKVINAMQEAEQGEKE